MKPTHSPEQDNVATFAALTMVLIVVVGLLGLAALVIPDVLWVLAVALGMGLFIVLHYFVWGRWLTQKLRDQESADDEGENQPSEPNSTPRS